MKQTYPKKAILYFLSCLLFICFFDPKAAQGIETTFNGETVTWNITGLGDIKFQACSSQAGPNYGCLYIANMPAPGTHLDISASIVPAHWSTWANWLQIYNIPAGTILEKSCTPGAPPCVPGSKMELTGSTMFVNDVSVTPYSVINSFMIVFGGDDISPFEIKVNLFNNSPFTIDARPDLLGGPDDNECIKFTDGTPRPRWKKFKGSGPGL